MASDLWPTTQELAALLDEELTAVGGAVLNAYRDEDVFFARGVLPAEREAGPGDKLQGGVALRAAEDEVLVHPYVFRQVCSNGAIFARTVGTRHLRRDESDFVVIPQIRDAIRACCGDEAFAADVELMAAARDAEADMFLNLMPHLSRLGPVRGKALMLQVMRRFRRDKDRSRYGLMNAVTATARETRDPAVRWRLEELGGGIAAAVTRPVPSGGTGVAKSVVAESPEDVLVG